MSAGGSLAICPTFAGPTSCCGTARWVLRPQRTATGPRRPRVSLLVCSTGSSSSGGCGGGGGISSGRSAAAAPPRPPGKMNKLLQNVNVAGTSLFFQILASDQRLAVPHVSVADIRWVNWDALSAAGFKACVFDKDNTLCKPFAIEVDEALKGSVEAARAAFGGRLAIYSNSAGLAQYDPQGEEAEVLERQFNIHCLRHTDKKPAGGCSELEAHFGCPASDIVFVGDRYLTDIVFGNRHGMLTVRVAPLTAAGEPPGVLVARRVEEACVSRWAANGVKAPPHARLPGSKLLGVVQEPGGGGGGSSGGGSGK